MRKPRPALGVFVILMVSYAFFWHSRDWNSSSRLMLTYSWVDRGTACINGLEDHTRDRARIGDRYFSDKQPGYSILASAPYAIGKALFKLPPHPVGRKGDGFTHWIADYWVALLTSGLLSSLCGSLLTIISIPLGCGPRRAMLVGLAYGLATPAYVYATLNYGHQAVAFFSLAAFAAMNRGSGSGYRRSFPFVAGVCAAMAVVVELQAAPISALMGLFLLARVRKGGLPRSSLLAFATGASLPTFGLLTYNASVFGSPFDMGYFHEDLAQFSAVHSASNPLGLGRLAWSRLDDLLWGEHRGLIVFAPVLILAPIGWVVLARKRIWGMFAISLGVVASAFLVNLSYPEWTGGWSTGPRLLVPALPFAMLPVAAILGIGRRPVVVAVAVLSLIGFAEMTVFQAVGGRVPPAPEASAVDSAFHHPFRQIAWPMFRGDPIPRWWIGRRFDRTILDARWSASFDALPVGWRWLRFAPLVATQGLMIAGWMLAMKSRPDAPSG